MESNTKIAFEFFSYVSPILVFYLSQVLNLIEHREIAIHLLKGVKINFYTKTDDKSEENPSLNPFRHILRDLAAVNFSVLISILIRIILKFPNILLDQVIMYFFLLFISLIFFLFLPRIPPKCRIRWRVIGANLFSVILIIMIILFLNIEYRMINIELLIYMFNIIILITVVVYYIWYRFIESKFDCI